MSTYNHVRLARLVNAQSRKARFRRWQSIPPWGDGGFARRSGRERERSKCSKQRDNGGVAADLTANLPRHRDLATIQRPAWGAGPCRVRFLLTVNRLLVSAEPALTTQHSIAEGLQNGFV